MYIETIFGKNFRNNLTKAQQSSANKILRGRGGGAHRHFVDKDAHPRTAFGYPRNGITQNS